MSVFTAPLDQSEARVRVSGPIRGAGAGPRIVRLQRGESRLQLRRFRGPGVRAARTSPSQCVCYGCYGVVTISAQVHAVILNTLDIISAMFSCDSDSEPPVCHLA